MIYKIEFSDNSFYLVDETFKLCLFRNAEAKTPIRIPIKTYLKRGELFFRNWVFIDEPEPGFRIPLNFSITEFENDENLKLNERYKYSNDIKIGDKVKGPDGPRTVLELHTGEDEMFEIDIDGVTYTVNGGHVLHLINKETNEAIDMPVNVFLLMDDDFQNSYYMEKIITD